jgi:hypothetical protein
MKRIGPREAIRCFFKEKSPQVEAYYLSEDVPADGVLIRNIFSLAGTQEELSALKRLPQPFHFPHHPGYASIGRVEEVGKQCKQFAPGDWVLLPAQYSTYTLLASSISRNQGSLVKKIAYVQDPLKVLFVPHICLALYLAQQRRESRVSPLLLLGCNLLSSILFQILEQEDGNHPIVFYRDADDLSEEHLSQCGAQEIFSPSRPLPPSLCRNIDQAYIFSSSHHAKIITHELHNRRCFCIPVHADKDADHRMTWLSNERIEEAIEWLEQKPLKYEALIAQHVHIEAILTITEATQQNTYRGRALIYDW